MAATSVALQSCLCFLVKKIWENSCETITGYDPRLLRPYVVDELCRVKYQLTSDVKSMKLTLFCFDISQH